ncbi:baseplate assembly protein [Acetobacter senegalensis]|uniref:Baseplate assembly protein n=1 Tax=Acetobacter senegalensis TaxID=446692 RepID=A0A149U5J5_9PROT|nr:baseplate assembly protein [Acetobacter senegalensis]KXV60671.1 baseplate assembly protein [Acetobacter senegalensis]
MADKYTGTKKASDGASNFNALNSAIRRILSMGGGPALVEVKAVNGTGLKPAGFVDILPMVHQQDGAGRTTPHGMIYGAPYARLQGGKRAFICDPSVGDIGIAIICARDISSVKINRKPSAPGSFRQFDLADAVYLGGYLNAAPEEYCGWINGDFHVKTAGKFIVDAAECDFNCKVNVTGPVAASGDVTAGGISLEKHVHGGVQGGSSTTSTPE